VPHGKNPNVRGEQFILDSIPEGTLQELSLNNINYPVIFHTDHRGKENEKAKTKPPDHNIDRKKINFSFLRKDIQNKWYKIYSDTFVHYKVKEPIAIRLENHHHFPIYFSIFERKEKSTQGKGKESVKIYPNESLKAFKSLPAKNSSANNPNDNYIEVSFGVCEYSKGFHGKIEFQDIIVEVSSTADLNQMREHELCVVSIPYVVAVSMQETSQIDSQSIEDEENELLKKLEKLGFTNEERNKEILKKNNKDFDKSVIDLVNENYN